MTDPIKSNKIFYEKGLYSVTVNPDDKHQYFGKPNRLELFRNFINEAFLAWPEYGITYYFTIELSEPKDNTKYGEHGPRLHLHGIVKLCSKNAVKKLLMDELYKLTKFSKYQFDTITHPTVWVTYMNKQQHILQTNPITSLAVDYCEYFWPHLEDFKK